LRGISEEQEKYGNGIRMEREKKKEARRRMDERG
jgi:hypothetical protein